VAPSGTEPVMMLIPAEADRVSILGEKLTVLGPDGPCDVHGLRTSDGADQQRDGAVSTAQTAPGPARAGSTPVTVVTVAAPPGLELLSIIVPVFNEVRTVRAVIERLSSIALPIDREILIVDDGSTDGTRGGVVGRQAQWRAGHGHRGRAECREREARYASDCRRSRDDRGHSGRRSRARPAAACFPRPADRRAGSRCRVWLAVS
jgi:hypothetical protein